MGGHRVRCATRSEAPVQRDVRRDTVPAGPVLSDKPVMRESSLEELSELCRGIHSSFVHLETRDSYGTDTELPHLTKWRRGEPDDYAWLAWWLEMLHGHRAAGRTCRRARIVSEPLSEYQQWALSHARRFIDAGEDIRYVPRPKLTTTLLPGSGDFYVFDDNLVVFLHYAGTGTNTSFQITTDRHVVSTCRQAFDSVWDQATPVGDYYPA
jgi:hypothetical protein